MTPEQFRKEIYEQAEREGWLDELKESLTIRYLDNRTEEEKFWDSFDPDKPEPFCSIGPVNVPIMFKIK